MKFNYYVIKLYTRDYKKAKSLQEANLMECVQLGSFGTKTVKRLARGWFEGVATGKVCQNLSEVRLFKIRKKE